MPKARYLAPWHQADLMEAVGRWKAEGKEVDAALLASLRGKPAIYHCISRVVDRRFVLGTREKEQFVAYMRLYERFCQVRVLAYAVMSNHFHLLLEVPARPEDGGRSWSDEKLLRHLSLLYSKRRVSEIRWQLRHYREQGLATAAENLRQSFFYRMWDLSEFMKTLKQRFARWFNKRHERKGTLWEERFKSLLVESGHAARVMAAYIDLNPVRAGLVTVPENYRWCSFGEAVGGRKRAREGLQRVLYESEKANTGEAQAAAMLSWRAAARRYREILGRHLQRDTDSRKNARHQPPPLPEHEALLQPVRHFIDGLVLGTQRYVDEVFRLTRSYFGPKRQDGARHLRGIHTDLFSMRDLRRR